MVELASEVADGDGVVIGVEGDVSIGGVDASSCHRDADDGGCEWRGGQGADVVGVDECVAINTAEEDVSVGGEHGRVAVEEGGDLSLPWRVVFDAPLEGAVLFLFHVQTGDAVGGAEPEYALPVLLDALHADVHPVGRVLYII